MFQFKRPYFNTLFQRLLEPRKFIQILIGPRQTGKTTLIQQVLENINIPAQYCSADAVPAGTGSWIDQQWNTARMSLKKDPQKGIVLVFDEIQKIDQWSEKIKLNWDEDSINENKIQIVLLGSSSLLIRKGLTESLAGRFELNHITHWTYQEMKEAFHTDLEHFLFFGGYPGSADLFNDENRWRHYITESLIEPVITKDILLMNRIDKPALLKKLFELGSHYSGQIFSYNKILGQLTDAGNTTTLAHYLDLLSAAGLLTGINKYSAAPGRIKASSPKFQVFNNALFSVYTRQSFTETIKDPETWGRVVESAVGAALINMVQGTGHKLYYWREADKEVDFILAKGDNLVALEVKNGRMKGALPGIEKFCKQHVVRKKLLIGMQGIPLEDFFTLDLNDLIE